MRTDVRISNEGVYLPNSSIMGYSKSRAKKGDLIIYTINGRYNFGRVIGRIDHMPEFGPEDPNVTGMLCVLQLSENGLFAYERWVVPGDVIECYAMSEHDKAFAAKFWTSDWKKGKVDELRQGIIKGG
jgi:hypothetical protein